MRRFVVKLVLFLAPLLAGWATLERRLHDQPNSYTSKTRLLAERGSGARIAVFGSSHEAYGVAPRAFPCPGVNLALLNQSLFYDGQLVAKYEPVLRELRLAVFGISYFSLEFALRDSIERWRIAYYHHFLGLPMEPGMPWLDLSRFSLAAMYGPREALRRVTVPAARDAGDADLGWLAPPGPPIRPLDAVGGRDRISFHNSVMKPEHAAENLVPFEEGLHRLRRRGVTIAFVSLPVFDTYARAMDPQHLARLRQELVRLQAEYGSSYHDYTSDPRFVERDFQDHDHLTPAGAAKFTLILNTEVIGPAGACGPAR